MANHSCFGDPWRIWDFKNSCQAATVEQRSHEILYLEQGVVELSMELKPLKSARPVRGRRAEPREIITLEIVAKMEFRGILPKKDLIKIDFFVVCGDFHHDMDSTVLTEQIVCGRFLTNTYHCNKENLGTDSNLTPDDILTLISQFSVSPDIVEIRIQKSTFEDINPIERLFADEEFADFVFSVRGVDFKVHKAIIAIRSKVFEAMIQNDMKEKSDNRAEITDVDPAVFKEMLRYVYTGKVENLPNVVQELTKVAEKYDLQGLKNICEDELSKGLCPSNAVELLKQADLFGCERLKAQTIEFICRNSTYVMDTDAWKHFASSHSSKLISEVCRAMSKGKAIRYIRFRPTYRLKILRDRDSNSDSSSGSD